MRWLATLAAITLIALAIAPGCTSVLDVDFGAAHPADTDASAGEAGTSPGSHTAGCETKTCAAQGFECGTQSDGCSATLDCGACSPDKDCVTGKCTCRPTTCATLGAQCGTVNDGCGGALDCGKCAAGQACEDGKCVCKSTTCADQGANCGNIPDGCSNTLSCGTCSGATPNCGGGGPNKCGANPCSPKSCAAQGKNCGTISDGCGGTLNCGGCSSGTCGGGGTANVCGCTPITCAQAGATCGSIGDGCGGTLNCGGCTSGYACNGSHTCTCSPTSCAAQGKNCGTISDGCSGTLNCGSCTSPDSCGGSGAANVCGCTPDNCDVYGCGNHPDGCGGTLYCGTCGGTCLVAGTSITMADGSTRPIEAVRVGDRVQSVDHATGRLVTATVTATRQHGPEGSADGIVVVNGKLRATRNHPIRVGGVVLRMEQLKVGDELTRLGTVTAGASALAQPSTVETIAIEPGGVRTYDIRVDGPGNYFADSVNVLIKPEPL